MNRLRKTGKFLSVSLIFLLVAFLAGCSGHFEANKSGETPTIKTVRLDGCDYLAFQQTHGYWSYTLKGNGNCGLVGN